MHMNFFRKICSEIAFQNHLHIFQSPVVTCVDDPKTTPASFVYTLSNIIILG